MGTNFPTGLDSITNPASGDYLNSPSHSTQHTTVNDAIEAIEGKVGINSSADTNSLDYKVANKQNTLINSAGLASALNDETGTGLAVFNNTPTLITPVLGIATATSINKVAITAPASTATLTLADGSTLATSGAYSQTLTSIATTNVTLPASGTLATFEGWGNLNATCTYASADSPTFTFTITGDYTTQLYPGVKIKLTQTTVKYFIVTASSYSVNTTTVTIYGGTDYTLANAAITLPFYSTLRAPLGFPLNPAKWTVTTTDATLRSQASPTGGTWYNLGSISISIPIGIWEVGYHVHLQFNTGISPSGDTTIMSTLSTADNSESDNAFTTETNSAILATGDVVGATRSRFKVLSLAAKTVYYLNGSIRFTQPGTLYSNNPIVNLTIQATSVYL